LPTRGNNLKDRGEGVEGRGRRSAPPGPLPPFSLTGAILAGGWSRRLGQDKATLTLQGKPLAQWVADALKPLVADLWLVTNHPETHLFLGLPLITDLRPFLGPLGGLYTALFYARTPWVLAAAVDAPLLSPALLAGLAARAARTRRPLVVCRSPRGLQPLPGLYSPRLLRRLGEYLKNHRHLVRFLETLRSQELSWEEVQHLDPEGLSFLNLNTPADLARAAPYLAAAGGQGGQAH
jgi:molybdopterin-guanine dinucleotide biosynthesis protein A